MKSSMSQIKTISKKSSDTINLNTKRERCEKMYQGYHKKFPSVETLTSTEYLQHLQSQQLRLQINLDLITNDTDTDTNSETMNKIPRYTLVDVRSKPEQQVSMIPNAITLEQFEANLNANANANVNRNDKKPSSLEAHVVVTYCTIGYRSGLEAQRLRDQYNLNVRNLDGIVGYTHACTALTLTAVKNKSNISNANANADAANVDIDVDYNLIDPKTKEATKKVHVFGSAWDVASDDFQTLWFGKFDMALRGIGVGFKAFLGGIRSFFQKCRSSCLTADAVVRSDD